MKKLIMSHAALLLLGCYDPGATEHLDDESPVTPSPTIAAPQLAGTAVVRSPGNETDEAVAGVEACALDLGSSLCTRSANDGSYALRGLIAGTRARVRYAKTGFVSLWAEYDILEHCIGADVFLLSPAALVESARKSGTTRDLTTSAGVVISANWTSYGASFPLDGVRAHARNEAKFSYASLSNEIDVTLEATSASGWGIALGLEPGPVGLEFSHIDPTISCGRVNNRNGTLERSFTVQAVPGELTLATVVCLHWPEPARAKN